MEGRLQMLNGQKDSLERTINNAISKWRERDDNKDKLNHLYRELSRASTLVI